MLPDPKLRCPATGFEKSCREILAACDCPKFVSIKGIDPQTGAVVDRHGCADSFVPLLLVEIAQKANQTSAEVHELRNDVFKAEGRQQAAVRDFAFANGQRELLIR